MALSTRSKVALYLAVFLSCISFAIVMPSLWPYLHTLNSTEPFFALVVALYSVGEAAGALLFGTLSATRPARTCMLLASTLGALGAFLYVLAQPFPGRVGPALVLVARLLQGVWTGAAQAVQTAYLAAVLPPHLLTSAIVTLNAYACMGFVAGPAFALSFSLLPPVRVFAAWRLDQLTSPGYFVLLCALVCIALFSLVFDEPADTAHDPADDVLAHAPVEGEHDPLLSKEEAAGLHPCELPRSKLRLLPLALCNVFFFVHFYGFALQETVTTPLVQQLYSWSVLQANLLFTGSGVLALLCFGLLAPLTTVVSDRALTAWSLGLGAAGYLLLVFREQLEMWRFLLGFAVISVAFPVGRATTISLYTKLLPMHAQGSGQGIILAVGAVARILGPFWAVQAVVGTGGGALVFGGTATAFAVCLGAMLARYRHFAT